MERSLISYSHEQSQQEEKEEALKEHRLALKAQQQNAAVLNPLPRRNRRPVSKLIERMASLQQQKADELDELKRKKLRPELMSKGDILIARFKALVEEVNNLKTSYDSRDVGEIMTKIAAELKLMKTE